MTPRLKSAMDLMGRMMAMGNPVTKGAASSRPGKGSKAKGRCALRAWRIIMDNKLITLMLFVRVQADVDEWFPELPTASCLPPSDEEETLEDVYAPLIVKAKRLTSLKAKEGPSVSASTCIHPKNQLKGGGNKSSSYIVCRACHSRWENTVRSAELQKALKEDKKEGARGHLSKTEEKVDTVMTASHISTKMKEHEAWRDMRSTWKIRRRRSKCSGWR